MKKPWTLELTARTAIITEWMPVPGADYLQPAHSYRIPLKIWQLMIASGLPHQTVFYNFTPAQLAAHGVAPEAIESEGI